MYDWLHKNPHYFRFVILTLSNYFSLFILSFGQVSYPIFEHLTTEDGLSSDKVEAIIQDHEGFYWIATQNGLNRYDGTSFKSFRHHEGDSTSLTNDFCLELAEDANGDIWVATNKGVSCYRRSKGYFKSLYVTHPIRNFEIANRIQSIAIDKENNIWLAGVGLWKYDHLTDSVILFSHQENNPASILDDGFIFQLVYDSLRVGLWLTTDKGVNFFGIEHNQFHHSNYNPNQWVIFDRAKDAELAIDHQHQIWFRNVNDTLCQFSPEENKITPTSGKLNFRVKNLFADRDGNLWIYHWAETPEIFDPKSGISDTSFFVKHHRRSIICERIQSVYEDQNDNFWIATNLGISIYNKKNQFYRHHQLSADVQDSKADSLNILGMCQTSPGKLWISTDHGLFNYDLKTEKSKRISGIPPVRYVSALCADDGRIWMSAKNELICIDAQKESIVRRISLPSDIFFIKKGLEDVLWVGLWLGGLCEVNLKDYSWKNYLANSPGIKTNDLVSGLPIENGLWIGYNGGYGFSKYNKSSGELKHFHPNESETSNIAAGTITAIAKDPDHNLWLGTFGNGIFLFNESNGTYKNFQHDEGLKCNYINSIIPDPEGNLWISTADGLNYLQAGTHSISQLDMDLVFRSNGVVTNGMMGTDGHIYFFCYKSFVEIDPSTYQPDLNFPQIVISSFRVLNTERPIDDKNSTISLRHNENFFSFEYSALKTQPSKVVHYAYMLDGMDKEWNEAGEKTTASYTNVPGGSYRFKLKVTNDKGEWSNAVISIPVQVSPPFWLTWWFVLLCVLFISGVIYALYRFRIQQLRKIYTIKTKISQDLHDDVGASLSSIHIYSSVAEEALRHNPEKAEKIVQQIKQNSRQVMENMSDIIWAMNSGQVDGESLIGRIKNYGYDLLSQKNIECIYDIDPQVERKLEAPEMRKNVLLIVKEALNNIAKYSKATKANVSIALNSHMMKIKIQDNGMGFDQLAVNNGNGLTNMKQRTQSLGGDFSVQSKPGEGTQIESQIPLARFSDL